MYSYGVCLRVFAGLFVLLLCVSPRACVSLRARKCFGCFVLPFGNNKTLEFDSFQTPRNQIEGNPEVLSIAVDICQFR